MKRCRMYFDESGDHRYDQLETPGRRYLALCGIMFEEEYYVQFQNQLEALKNQLFRTDPDESIILHREDMINRRGVFGVLERPEIREKWENGFLSLINGSRFEAVIVVIDKKNHADRYTHPDHPYHYCFSVLVERYWYWLGTNRRGDMMGEVRGRREDELLRAEYEHIHRAGTRFIDDGRIQQRLTGQKLKLKPKRSDIAGLQLADLLAHPAKQRLLVRRKTPRITEGRFGARVADVLWTKLRKRWDGETRGFGEVYVE